MVVILQAQAALLARVALAAEVAALGRLLIVSPETVDLVEVAVVPETPRVRQAVSEA